jgi:hypothetical protein
MKTYNGGYSSFVSDMLSGVISAEKLKDGNPLQYYDPQALDVVALDGVYLSFSSINPSVDTSFGGLGYGTWILVSQGKALFGIDANDVDFNSGVIGGSKNITPSGTVSQPTYTGTPSQATSAVSAGTPSGSVSVPSFTGTPSIATNAVTAGTPAGTVSTPTFTGNALATHTHTFTGSALGNHAHELPVQLVSGTLSRQLASTVFGTGTSRAAQSQQTETANTTSAAVALSQSVSAGTPAGTNAAITAGTPSGTISTPTFTGSALGTHSHTITPSGTINAPSFTGNPHADHSHTITTTGTVSQPSFTGSQHTNLPPYMTLYVWRRIA